MNAYFVATVDITDPDRYDEYRQQAVPSIERYEGRFVVRGSDFESLEGDPPFSRLVIIEFATREQAHAWWDSPEYAAAKKTRIDAAEMRAVLMDGFNA